MKKDNFKKAKCIEMYDSKIALTTYEQNYFSTHLTGRSSMSYKPAAEIHLSDIAMVAEMLNLQVNPKVKLSPSAGAHSEIRPGLFRKDHEIDSISIPINKTLFDETNDSSSSKIKITSLECEVLPDKMLNIRITSLQSNMEKKITERIETKTYCGSYTIWWENDEDEFKEVA
jgi:hypothetical protein